MRYIVPTSIVDHFGGAIVSRAESRAYYNTGTGDAPIIAKYRKLSRRQFFAVMGRRSTEPGTVELERRNHFAQVCSLVGARLSNPAVRAIDEMQFRNQSQYKTLRAYVWHLVETSLQTTQGTAPNAG